MGKHFAGRNTVIHPDVLRESSAVGMLTVIVSNKAV